MDEVADCFVVIEDSVLEGYRKVPKAVLDPYFGEGEDDLEVTIDDVDDDD